MGKDGICVNAVGPGLTRSESLASARGDELLDADDEFQIASRAIPRSQVPEEITDTIVFFLTDGVNFVTGQTLLVDGGSLMN